MNMIQNKCPPVEVNAPLDKIHQHEIWNWIEENDATLSEVYQTLMEQTSIITTKAGVLSGKIRMRNWRNEGTT